MAKAVVVYSTKRTLQWPTADSLDHGHHDVSAVQNRDREHVQYGQIDVEEHQKTQAPGDNR